MSRNNAVAFDFKCIEEWLVLVDKCFNIGVHFPILSISKIETENAEIVGGRILQNFTFHFDRKLIPI